MTPDWLRYANQGATRNQPLSSDLVQALSFLPELGLGVEVFSGGQPSAGGGPRVGSVRHDGGGAADVFFLRDGERISWENPDHIPLFQEIVRRGRENGLTGFGAGEGYMQPGSMHLGFGNPAVWGADGKGANAPDWLREAFGSASVGDRPRLSFGDAVPQGAQPGLAGLFDMGTPVSPQAGLASALMGRRKDPRAEEDDDRRRRVALADAIRY